MSILLKTPNLIIHFVPPENWSNLRDVTAFEEFVQCDSKLATCSLLTIEEMSANKETSNEEEDNCTEKPLPSFQQALVPLEFRTQVFASIHSLSHTGETATLHLLRSRYVWKNLSKDVAAWCKTYLECQKSKVYMYTKTQLVPFQPVDTRFTNVKIDVVSSMPPSRNNRYVLTYIDRFNKWVEAVFMVYQAETTIAQAFLQEWVFLFDLPEIITT
ncbi:hypothetical protein AVEN_53671-1 [Araneus ventricosus]|uniref:RNA-directed DNA polymerase n=1 Tax=Araneus ventricosus TaxID=182803 RepID=A0A4Y2P113_ARAVE|nr:hypothetical protein AVEN_53671-1 [Araneus ventricosus]